MRPSAPSPPAAPAPPPAPAPAPPVPPPSERGGWTPDLAAIQQAGLPAIVERPGAIEPRRLAERPEPAAPEELNEELTWPDVEWPEDVQAPLLVTSRRVVVGGVWSGAGRTTVTAGIGMALARSRHDRVVAVDAGPAQRASLAARAGLVPGQVGIREFARVPRRPVSLTEVRAFLLSGRPGGLAVLPGASDVIGEQLSKEEVERALEELSYWFATVLVDLPPGWLGPAAAGAIDGADILVLVCRARGSDVAAARGALDALAHAGYGGVARRAVVAVVSTGPSGGSRRAMRRFAQLADVGCTVVAVPYDPLLARAGPCVWSRLRRKTRRAFEGLARALDDRADVTLGT